jgi:cell division protein FtsI/penicillin-binding protein 2
VVMALAWDEGKVDGEAICPCSGPVEIGKYTIRTWNNEYHPESSVSDIIIHSDNVGMVWVAERLGTKKLVEGLEKFGFGEKTGVDLQDESAPSLRPEDKWGEVDRAVAAFGQGIAVTPLQMARAVAAIASGGELVTPRVVREIDFEGKRAEVIDGKKTRVISKKTAEAIKEMMVKAVDEGEAKWAKPEGYRIAGKTGTAQIPVAGHYDEEKTIASFVGFAPADDPKFVMLVTLQEPESSPWGSETAAPLWFEIAKEMLVYWGISGG